MASTPDPFSPPAKRPSLRRSFLAAGRGFAESFRAERNLRIHVAAAVPVLWLAWLLQCVLLEWALVCLAIGMVLMAELINTAIESAVDLASPEWAELARKAKDASAAGVLVAACTAIIVGSCVFGPRLWQWLAA